MQESEHDCAWQCPQGGGCHSQQQEEATEEGGVRALRSHPP